VPNGSTAGVTCPQQVAVVGAGAIGGVLADAAQAAGHEVTLYTRTPFDRLSVERDGSVHDVKARVVTDPGEVTAADWVLLATKANQTLGAAGWLTRLTGPDTTVVVVQNGVEHAARLAPLGLPGRVLPALTYIGAHRSERAAWSTSREARSSCQTTPRRWASPQSSTRGSPTSSACLTS
jgi:2-dehydropantoate 2-reductase